MNRPHISIVVPVYKAEECLEELYRRLRAVLEPISPDFEIVLVEDCGGDGSWQVIERLAAQDARVKGIQFSRNFGQYYGITAGLDHCLGDWVVVMDCDLQDRPEEIPHLYAKALEGYDVVLARRGQRKDRWHKRLASWLFYKIFAWLADIEYDGEVGTFRLLSRKVVINYRRFGEQLRYFSALVQWLGFPTAYVDVEHGERFAGKSAYSWSRLLKLATDTIIAFSDKPLRLAVRFGFALSSFSFLSGVYILYRAVFYGFPIVGWSSLFVSLYFIGGIIIALLGVLGIYLGKTFDEAKKRPLYVVSCTTTEAMDTKN